MTFDIFSLVILVLALAGMFLGWRASVYIGRLFILCWRLGIAAAFGVFVVYVFYVSWPYLIELQRQGQVYFPSTVSDWKVVVK